ncbi:MULTISPECIES: maleylacetoacetate isomerase [Luteimonas]|uniref:maleylacetoacetate isomerase n=1 Tax=Luteimonas TaxID=83614 RepID=UPI000C7DE857|nr:MULTISPECIES: maleylacetoacetate isomerase [Luteimonas]
MTAAAGDGLTLLGYWRSSAAYRVRIGLRLKGLEYFDAPVHLVRDGGEQRQPTFAARNPQKLVPALQHGDVVLTQSLAILEYLDEVWPTVPLLPAVPLARQRVRALAQLIAADVHPLNNLRVLQWLEHDGALPPDVRAQWIARWIVDGFDAFEALLAQWSDDAGVCIGERPTIADCALIPQVYNARRFDVDLTPYPRIRAIEDACLALPAFAAARPEVQPDAPAAG